MILFLSKYFRLALACPQPILSAIVTNSEELFFQQLPLFFTILLEQYNPLIASLCKSTLVRVIPEHVSIISPNFIGPNEMELAIYLCQRFGRSIGSFELHLQDRASGLEFLLNWEHHLTPEEWVSAIGSMLRLALLIVQVDNFLVSQNWDRTFLKAGGRVGELPAQLNYTNVCCYWELNCIALVLVEDEKQPERWAFEFYCGDYHTLFPIFPTMEIEGRPFDNEDSFFTALQQLLAEAE